MPHNIAVIGDRDFISGFKALGCTLYPVDDKRDMRLAFNQAIEANSSFIFILESYALKIMDLLQQYREKSRPLIIPLPDFRQDLSGLKDLLSQFTIRAVGKDIS